MVAKLTCLLIVAGFLAPPSAADNCFSLQDVFDDVVLPSVLHFANAIGHFTPKKTFYSYVDVQIDGQLQINSSKVIDGKFCHDESSSKKASIQISSWNFDGIEIILDDLNVELAKIPLLESSVRLTVPTFTVGPINLDVEFSPNSCSLSLDLNRMNFDEITISRQSYGGMALHFLYSFEFVQNYVETKLRDSLFPLVLKAVRDEVNANQQDICSYLQQIALRYPNGAFVKNRYNTRGVKV